MPLNPAWALYTGRAFLRIKPGFLCPSRPAYLGKRTGEAQSSNLAIRGFEPVTPSMRFTHVVSSTDWLGRSPVLLIMSLHAFTERGQDEGISPRSRTDRETHECPLSNRTPQRTSTERGAVAAGREDRAGCGGPGRSSGQRRKQRDRIFCRFVKKNYWSGR